MLVQSNKPESGALLVQSNQTDSHKQTKETQSQTNQGDTVTIKSKNQMNHHSGVRILQYEAVALWMQVWLPTKGSFCDGHLSDLLCIHSSLCLLVCTVSMHCWYTLLVCTPVCVGMQCIVTWSGLLVLCFQHSTKSWYLVVQRCIFMLFQMCIQRWVQRYTYLKLISEVGSEVDSESFVCVWVYFCFRHGYCVWGICLIVVGASNRRKCLTWITMQSA